MICGAYNGRGSAWELAAVKHLDRSIPAVELLVDGPLAVSASGGSTLRCADIAGIRCIIDGYLYEPSRLAHELDLDLADGPALIAHAYARLGFPGLAKLRGRFFAALWDSRQRRGFLTCDPLATTSLFVWRGAGWLLFASELPELLAAVPSRPGPDPVAFPMWLGGGSCPLNRTLHEGVSRLGPGELIELGKASAETTRYWQPRYAGTVKGSPAELAAGLRHELERSTRRRFSGNATGVILSGGLDSSIVTAVACRTKRPGARLQTYSAVFPGSDFDESEKVAGLTAALRMKAAAFVLEPQGTVWLALEHAKRWQLPLIGAGAVVDSMVVAEAGRDGAELVMDGQAGDEVLGFSPYLVSDLLRRGRLLAALELAGRWPIGRPTTTKEKLWILKHCGLKGAAPHRLGRFVRDRRDPAALAPPWLLPALRAQYAALDDAWSWKSGSSGPRWWRYLADLLVQAPHRGLLVEYLRHRAAAAGVVNESPLYDIDLMDYCLRLPPELAFDSRFTRPLAREAMRGVMPDSVRLQSQKAVFSSFCHQALTGADSAGIEQLITVHDAELRAYADMDWVRRFWHTGRSKTGGSSTYWGTTVWRLAAAEAWLRSQADPASLDAMLDQVPQPSIRRINLSSDGTFFPLVHAPHSP